MMRFFSWLLTLRYKVSVKGMAEVKKISNPILFLFEHPAQVDAFLHATQLAKANRQLLPKYLAARDFTLLPVIGSLVKNFILPVPELTPRRRRLLLLELLMKDAIATLKQGTNLAFAPVGALIRQDGTTQLGGKTGVAQILQAMNPGEITIVTTQFEGLYGSATSRALTNDAPDPRNLLLAIKAFAKGGLFFSCRRRVKMTFAVHTDFPSGEAATVPNVNARLEKIFCEKRTAVFTPYNRIDKKTLPQLKLPPKKESATTGISRARFAILVTVLIRELASWPEKEVGCLLSNDTLSLAARLAGERAGKIFIDFDPANPPLNMTKVLTREAALDDLARERIVLESWERNGSFVDVAALVTLGGLIRAFFRKR